ncbi:hypothetical protein V1283_003772 [Bradyrhizobium sp. AZCC 2262]|uniref:hypothetical protein n=1 Tax=Bradyrhizobium sp. AZCC 2262 TaxID=3117022 RepID=UPI002FF29FCC
MAIPTAFDRSLGEIDDAAGSIMVQLRTIKHADPRDIPRLRETLRERLRFYVDQALALADESAAR